MVKTTRKTWGAEAYITSQPHIKKFSEYFKTETRAEALEKAYAWAELVFGMDGGDFGVTVKEIK